MKPCRHLWKGVFLLLNALLQTLSVQNWEFSERVLPRPKDCHSRCDTKNGDIEVQTILSPQGKGILGKAFKTSQLRIKLEHKVSHFGSFIDLWVEGKQHPTKAWRYGFLGFSSSSSWRSLLKVFEKLKFAGIRFILENLPLFDNEGSTEKKKRELTLMLDCLFQLYIISPPYMTILKDRKIFSEKNANLRNNQEGLGVLPRYDCMEPCS